MDIKLTEKSKIYKTKNKDKLEQRKIILLPRTEVVDPLAKVTFGKTCDSMIWAKLCLCPDM